MSCESCKDIERIDGVAPPCRASCHSALDAESSIPGINVCLIPPLSPDEARVLEMRAMLIRLNELNIGSAILRMYEAEREDLEMLAVVEEETRTKGSEQ